jgi:hypothetical protein
VLTHTSDMLVFSRSLLIDSRSLLSSDTDSCVTYLSDEEMSPREAPRSSLYDDYGMLVLIGLF